MVMAIANMQKNLSLSLTWAFFIPPRFYIGCEGCSDWFHGRCVGILQLEADTIDEYLCPKCDPRSKYNAPNMAELEDADLDLMRRLVKQIQVRFFFFAV